MHTQKMADGTFKVTLEAPRDPASGKRKQITRRRKTKREAIRAAEEEYDRRVARFGAWGNLETDRLTFRRVAEMFLEEYRQKEKLSTYTSRKTNMNKVFEYFDQIEITKINHKMCQHMIDDMLLNKAYSRNYTQSAKGTLNLVMKYAMRNGILDVNPAVGCVYPKMLVTVEELEREDYFETSLSKSEIRRLLKEFDSKRLNYKDSYEFYQVMYYTGMRPGEVMALKYDDFDFKKNEVRVTKTLFNPDDKKRGHTLLPPKNNKARRISFSPKLAEVIKPLIAKKKQMKAVFGDQYIDEKFLFCDHFGDPYKHGLNGKRFKKAAQAVNIDTDIFKPHSFRHAHVTVLVAAGVDIKVAQERLGHKNIKTTLGVYAHVTNLMRKHAITKMNDHMELALNLDSPKRKLINRGQEVVKTLYYH